HLGEPPVADQCATAQPADPARVQQQHQQDHLREDAIAALPGAWPQQDGRAGAGA
ncbi:unnamed protein product, partial [Prorocentrum cordatum]